MTQQQARQCWYRGICLGLCFLLATALAGCDRDDKPPLRIGVVHALTGTMAANEAPLVEAVKMAAEEINAEGGVLGQKVEVVVADSRSDPERAAREAERLIIHEHVAALFACWTSSCRKAVKPVVELQKSLMFYPAQYEGLEQSPNIIYTGATANQQIIPGTQWALEHLGKRVFLVGSNYIFPQVSNRIIRDIVAAHKGTIVGELYRQLGSQNFHSIADSISIARPDVILNTVNGDSNAYLFEALKAAGLNTLPIMSFSVDASNLRSLAPFKHPAHYTVWGYFQELPGAANQKFLSEWQTRRHKENSKDNSSTSAGTADITDATDAIEASYIGVKLWAQAAKTANSTVADKIMPMLGHQSVAAPSGPLAVDSDTQHLWKPMRIGRARPDGKGFDIVFDLGFSLKPQPFPAYRAQSEWQAILNDSESAIYMNPMEIKGSDQGDSADAKSFSGNTNKKSMGSLP